MATETAEASQVFQEGLKQLLQPLALQYQSGVASVHSAQLSLISNIDSLLRELEEASEDATFVDLKPQLTRLLIARKRLQTVNSTLGGVKDRVDKLLLYVNSPFFKEKAAKFATVSAARPTSAPLVPPSPSSQSQTTSVPAETTDLSSQSQTALSIPTPNLDENIATEFAASTTEDEQKEVNEGENVVVSSSDQ